MLSNRSNNIGAGGSDPLYTGFLKHFMELIRDKKEINIGSAADADICLKGDGILARHAKITFDGETFYLEPIGKARVLKDGREQAAGRFGLGKNAALVFGADLYCMFVNPLMHTSIDWSSSGDDDNGDAGGLANHADIVRTLKDNRPHSQ